jgi:CAAX protease family protein
LKIHRTTWALASYAVIVFAFRFGLQRSSVGQALGARLPYAFSSFALLLVPLWGFGFGAGDWLRERLGSRAARTLCGALLVVPYLVFAIHGGQFQWNLAIIMAGLPVVLAGLLTSSNSSKMSWQDVVVLATLVAVYMLHLIAGAWNYAGLAALPKLYVADVTLYLYIVVRELPGIGYSFLPQVSDFLIGLREWLFFLPFGIGLGMALNFTHFRPRAPSLLMLGTSLIVTFLLIAIPEEMFFRGVLQNLLESRFKSSLALAITAVLFGLSHFNKGAAFNWRYVLLASIAGIFYGRAWDVRHRVLASVLTHTAVDVAWSLWFR